MENETVFVAYICKVLNGLRVIETEEKCFTAENVGTALVYMYLHAKNRDTKKQQIEIRNSVNVIMLGYLFGW